MEKTRRGAPHKYKVIRLYEIFNSSPSFMDEIINETRIWVLSILEISEQREQRINFHQSGVDHIALCPKAEWEECYTSTR